MKSSLPALFPGQRWWRLRETEVEAENEEVEVENEVLGGEVEEG